MTEAELQSVMLELEKELSVRPVAPLKMLVIFAVFFAAIHLALVQSTGVGFMYENLAHVDGGDMQGRAIQHGLDTTEGGVLLLKSVDDYKHAVTLFSPLFIDFYAPW
jgi:UPF0716 family protein affecting phage T7 exclusion